MTGQAPAGPSDVARMIVRLVAAEDALTAVVGQGDFTLDPVDVRQIEGTVWTLAAYRRSLTEVTR